MNGRLTSLHHEIQHVEREGDAVKREEKVLKREIEKVEQEKGLSWGEPEDEASKLTHEVHMVPLSSHHRRHLHGFHPFGGSIFKHISDFFKKISHPGPAHEQSSKPIIPLNNILKPGAHPT